MDEANIEVYLRVRHPSLDPADITLALGLDPEHHWKAGDARPAAGDTFATGRYAESYWFGRVQVPSQLEGPQSLEGMLVLAAALLKSRKLLWKRISEEGGRAELLVSLQSEGPASIDLTSEAMSLLNGIGLSISIALSSQFEAA